MEAGKGCSWEPLATTPHRWRGRRGEERLFLLDLFVDCDGLVIHTSSSNNHRNTSNRINIAARNMRMPPDNPNSLEHWTASVAQELQCYDIAIAALNETSPSDHTQLVEHGSRYIFSVVDAWRMVWAPPSRSAASWFLSPCCKTDGAVIASQQRLCDHDQCIYTNYDTQMRAKSSSMKSLRDLPQGSKNFG